MSLDDSADRKIFLVSKRDPTGSFELPLSYLKLSSLVKNSLELGTVFAFALIRVLALMGRLAFTPSRRQGP